MLRAKRILLASEGRRIPQEAVDFAARLAKSAGASVHVLSIARVYGTSLGLPHPGLLPRKREWDEQRELVTAAVRALKKQGLKAQGSAVGTRAATKHILKTAQDYYCEAIVMAADPPRNWLIADFMWSQEPYRVRRRSRLPVYIVTVQKQEHRGESGEARGA
jgi:nucleotide-binding universal stress UspA family protein